MTQRAFGLRGLLVFFGERPLTLFAAITLYSLGTELTELFAKGTAIVTRHFEPCLLLGDWLTMTLRESDASNRFWFSIRPFSVTAVRGLCFNERIIRDRSRISQDNNTCFFLSGQV